MRAHKFEGNCMKDLYDYANYATSSVRKLSGSKKNTRNMNVQRRTDAKGCVRDVNRHDVNCIKVRHSKSLRGCEWRRLGFPLISRLGD